MRSGSGAIACGTNWSFTPSSLVANQIQTESGRPPPGPASPGSRQDVAVEAGGSRRPPRREGHGHVLEAAHAREATRRGPRESRRSAWSRAARCRLDEMSVLHLGGAARGRRRTYLPATARVMAQRSTTPSGDRAGIAAEVMSVAGGISRRGCALGSSPNSSSTEIHRHRGCGRWAQRPRHRRPGGRGSAAASSRRGARHAPRPPSGESNSSSRAPT